MRLWIIVGVLLALMVSAEAKKRTKVVVQKPYVPAYPAQPIAYPLMIVPPLAAIFDLARRTSCDPNVAVSTGKGDPGFDPAGVQTGNFLIPAIWQRCQSRPQPRS